MTREEEIKTAAEVYANGSPNATLRHKAFKDGAKWADQHPAKKQTIWHTPDIEPEPESHIIYTDADNIGFIFNIVYNPDLYVGMKKGWSAIVENFGITKWAYTDDIISL